MSTKDLDPSIKDMQLNPSARYAASKARITFDVSDGNGGREDLTVEYPLQDEKHLTMLMTKKVQDGDIERTESVPLPTAHILSSVIKDALTGEDK